MDQYSGSERRKSKRIPVDFTVVYQINKPLVVRLMVGTDSEVEAVMLDLSEGGMSIVTDYNIPSCTVLIMKFILINMDKSRENRIQKMNITGLVRYNILTANQKHRLGIYFTKIATEDKKAISDFVKLSLPAKA